MLFKGVPSDIGEHGATDNESSDDKGCENAGPESHAAEGKEKLALFAGEVDSSPIGQERLHSHGNQESCGPDESDPE